MGKQEIVVLGAGYAGVLCALRLARTNARVTLVNAAPHFVERIRLHELATGRAPRPRALADLVAGTGVELHVGWAEAIEPERQQLVVGGRGPLSFDSLVVALGSEPAAGPDGAREHAAAIAIEAGARRLETALRTLRPGARVVVIGGGLTALETASEVAERRPDLRVTLATHGRFGDGFSERGRRALNAAFDALRIERLDGIRIAAVERDRVVAEDGSHIASDVTVWAGGLAPNPLVQAAGLALNERGQMLVDSHLRSRSHPHVLGAGDVAAVDGPESRFLRMACASAMPMGAHAADVLAASLRGEPEPAFGLGFVARCVSLGRRRGLIQTTRADDSPRDLVVTGRAGAWVKEAVCRFTLAALGWERRRPGSYRGPGKTGRLPASPHDSSRRWAE